MIKNNTQMKENARVSIIAKSSNIPFVIKDYTFTKFIGKGGFGEIFLVENHKYNMQFVAKVMTVDFTEVERIQKIFDSEVAAMSTLNHPHIIRLYDYFQTNSQFFYIMEYCPNGSLHDEIAESGPMSYHRFIILAKQLISALDCCHSNGIAHRDIKPGNILLDKYNRAKLTDFGLSVKTRTGTLHKLFSGSCEYTAPEIFIRRPNDPLKGDIWALGVVFATLINGSSPWSGDSLGILRQQVQAGKYKLSKSVPQEISELISKMIVVNPYERMSTKDLLKLPLFKAPAANQPFIYRPRDTISWNSINRQKHCAYDNYIENNRIITVNTPVKSVYSVFYHHSNKINPSVKLGTSLKRENILFNTNNLEK